MTPEEKMRACKTVEELDALCKALWDAVKLHFGGQPAGFAALIVANLLQSDVAIMRAFLLAMTGDRTRVYEAMLRGIKETDGLASLMDSAVEQARAEANAELKQKVGN